MKSFSKNLVRNALIIAAPFIAQSSFADPAMFACHSFGSNGIAPLSLQAVFPISGALKNTGTSNAAVLCEADPQWSYAAPTDPQPQTAALTKILLTNTSGTPPTCYFSLTNGNNGMVQATVPFQTIQGSSGTYSFLLDTTQYPKGLQLSVPSIWSTPPNMRYKTHLVCNLPAETSLLLFLTSYVMN